MSTWITDPTELAARIVTPPSRIGIDTEFVRERTYWPQLALVQIALDDDTPDGGNILLLDPLAPGMTAALAPLLGNRNVLKVMHSASEDLIAFKYACGVLPQPLFDTQIAAALSGIGAGVGYQKLVEQITGTTLSKGETRSDWLRRPLSAGQLDYAADDVRYLFAVHDRLNARLTELGRSDWLSEDCARMIDIAADDASERWPHLSQRAAQYFDIEAQRRLLRLLRWREIYAREHDRPRGWILDNALAVNLAKQPPIDQADLQRQLDADPKAPKRLCAVIWKTLHTPLADEAELPDASAAEKLDKTTLRKLQTAVTTHSAGLGLPDGVLASRRALEALLLNRDWPAVLSGWRREQLEPLLQPVLSGR